MDNAPTLRVEEGSNRQDMKPAAFGNERGGRSSRCVLAMTFVLLFLTTLRHVSERNSMDFLAVHMEHHHAKNERTRGPYRPAYIETYIIEHADAYGWGDTELLQSTCRIWTDETATEVFPQLQAYLKELDTYQDYLKQHAPVADVRMLFQQRSSSTAQEEVCAQVDLHPQGLLGIFPSGQLSWTPAGYVEPLLPPLRHPRLCADGWTIPGGPTVGEHGVVLADTVHNLNWMLNLGYLIQDFGFMCRKQTITSRNIFIDMGASLNYHQSEDINNNPPFYLMEMFRKFGFPFDHIYAFEVTPIEPEDVYDQLPQEYIHAYHWINLPVSTDPESKQNPLQLILKDYNENDMIVVKLDIDTPDVEVSMVQQVLDDERYDSLIDHFYFEHHVHLNEMARTWVDMKDSVTNSLQLFQRLREKGIASHYWP